MIRHFSAVLISIVVHATAHAGYLFPGQILWPGQSVTSADNKYYVTMQSDGRLVLYRRSDGMPRWASDTLGKAAYTMMQPDGNLVLYSPFNTPVGDSGTAGHPGAYLEVKNDGDMGIYGPGQTFLTIGPDPTWNDPHVLGDVVGRDLAIPGIGFLGHIGIFDGGGNSMEVLNVPGNVVVYTPMSVFKSASSNYWGAASPAIPDFTFSACFNDLCSTSSINGSVTRNGYGNFTAKVALAMRAFQVKTIGADYTLIAQPVSAEPRIKHYSYIAPLVAGQPPVIFNSDMPKQRGLYRCDTFVRDVYKHTYTSDPALVTNSNSAANTAWKARVANLDMVVTPPAMFNTFKAGQ